MKSQDSSPTLISIAAPVYNEEASLKEFCRRTCEALSRFEFELILIDDGSQDGSWNLIQELSAADPRIKGYRFSRNFGHQAALSAGLEKARGAAVVLIDSDLQDPPEIIPLMIQKWQAGADIVYGVREERKGESFFKKMTATLYYRLLKKISRVDIPLESGDFRLLSRRVTDIVNHLPERIRFVRGITSWAGYRQEEVLYSRDARFSGVTKFSFLKMVQFAMDGITSFTSAPLQVATYAGTLITLASFVFLVVSVCLRIFTDAPIKGWTSLLTVIIMLGGIQLIILGLIGEYISRIYEEVKRRPLYLLTDATESADKKDI